MRPSGLSVYRALVVLVSLSGASAHSWVEQLLAVAPNGTFSGEAGFIRNYVPRTVPNFNESQDLLLTPPDGRANQSLILPTDPMCNPLQATQAQSSGNPRLQAEAGGTIALQYQENGHVTLPNNQPGKPANRGTVYIYGTSQPMNNEYLLTVHRNWTADGTGGDKRGKLLSTQNFDDGQCYQVNSGNISIARQNEFKFTATQPMGSNLWCQNDMVLPADLPAGQPYTLYWVWDWPTAPGTPSLPDGKEEIYSSCMDIDVIAATSAISNKEAIVAYAHGQAINNAVVSSYAAAIAAGSNIMVTTPLQDSVVQTTLVASTTTIATASPMTTQATSTELVAAPILTVYPVTTLMTTVTLPPGSEINSQSSTVIINSSAAVVPDPSSSITVTITPTVTITMQPPSSPITATAPSSALTAGSEGSEFSSASPLANSAAPSVSSVASTVGSAVPVSSSALPAANATAPTPNNSNCTLSNTQQQSRVFRATNLEDRAARPDPVVLRPYAKLRSSRSAKFLKV